MPSFPSRFRRLDDILFDLPVDDPLLLTELDGYLTGIAVSPEPIAPSEWLPPIWGGGYGEAAPFEDPLDGQLFADMVGARHAEILRDLGRGKPQPIFDVDERNGEILWEEWVGGFAMAMALRPESWAEGPAVTAMRTLIEVASEESTLTSVDINALCDAAAGAIPGLVVQLYAGAAPAAPEPGKQVGKVGRNDPCPCGSGKKHKRCCGG